MLLACLPPQQSVLPCVITIRESATNSETDSYPHAIPPSNIPLPCSVRVRVRSGVSRIRVRVRRDSIRVRFMVWVMGKCPGEEVSRGKYPTLNKLTNLFHDQLHLSHPFPARQLTASSPK